MTTPHEKAAKVMRLAEELGAMVDTYPQEDEDTPGGYCSVVDEQLDTAAVMLREYAALLQAQTAEAGRVPIDMILHCPKCHTQHIDAPEEQDELKEFKATPTPWNNDPHRSHLCHNCGTIWRPADVPTNGVASIKTKGKRDTWAPKEK